MLGGETSIELKDTPALAEANKSRAQHPEDTRPLETKDDRLPPRQSACTRRPKDGRKATDAEPEFEPTEAVDECGAVTGMSLQI